MDPETLMLYKLIVLYILNHVDFPMSNSQLTDFMTEKGYTNYFNIQQVINDLTSDNFIEATTTRSQTLYNITEEGTQTLDYFYKKISKDIRDDIDLYLTDRKYALREEVSSIADYYERRPGEYVVDLKILERDTTTVELIMAVGSASAAENACDKWKQKNADIYAYVLNSLLND